MSDTKKLVSVDEARALILEHIAPLGAENVFVGAASGRVTAERLVSRRDLPPSDNSAMDGYAVRATDLEGATKDAPVSLPCIGVQLAGGAFNRHVRPKEVVRIMTGGAVPPGVDAVIMRESTDESLVSDEHTGPVRFHAEANKGDHIRRRGEDVAEGDEVVAAGTRITPGHVNLLASAGYGSLSVHRRPRVAILASGDELRELGEPWEPTDIINSNAHAVAAAVRAVGGVPEVLGIARDTLEDHKERIDGARSADVLITIGGVSAGTHDFVRPALEALDVELDLFKVAMRPGKPLAFARRGPQRIFGLPGNPVSSVVGTTLFVAPALRRMQGMQAVAPRPVRATLTSEGRKKRQGFTFFERARVQLREAGGFDVELTDKRGSGQVSGLAWANALCVLPAEADAVAKGDELDVILLDDSMLLA